MRIVVASLAATAVVLGLHAPHGDWIIWAIVQVSSEDAGASIIKGVQRIVATLVGGLVGMLIGIAFADEPQFMFVAIGVVVAVCMFLTRTTSAPDAGLLVAFTMLLVVTSRLDAPDAQVDTALWRVLMILVGVVLGTGAQLVLWPRDPEGSLLDEVGQRLARVEGLLARAATPSLGSPNRRGPPDLIAVSGLARELDLLANAEARYPSLRRRHTEQIALVTETERLLTNALWLAESLGDRAIPIASTTGSARASRPWRPPARTCAAPWPPGVRSGWRTCRIPSTAPRTSGPDCPPWWPPWRALWRALPPPLAFSAPPGVAPCGCSPGAHRSTRRPAPRSSRPRSPCPMRRT